MNFLVFDEIDDVDLTRDNVVVRPVNSFDLWYMIVDSEKYLHVNERILYLNDLILSYNLNICTDWICFIFDFILCCDLIK